MAASKENPWGLASTTPTPATPAGLSSIQKEQAIKAKEEEKLKQKRDAEFRKQALLNEEKQKNPWSASQSAPKKTAGLQTLAEIQKVIVCLCYCYYC